MGRAASTPTRTETSMTQDGGSSPARVTARSAVVVASVLVTCALYLGREVMVPIAIGAVLAAILAPVVAALRRARVPAPAGATVSVVGSLALLVALGAALEVPLRGLSATVPRSLATAQTKLQRVVDPLRRLSST